MCMCMCVCVVRPGCAACFVAATSFCGLFVFVSLAGPCEYCAAFASSLNAAATAVLPCHMPHATTTRTTTTSRSAMISQQRKLWKRREKPQTKRKGKGKGRLRQWVHWPSPSRTQHQQQQQRRRCPVSCLAGREGKPVGWGSGTATAGRSAVRLVCLFFASGFYPIFNALAFPIPAHTHTHNARPFRYLSPSLYPTLSFSLSFIPNFSLSSPFQPPRSFRQLDQKGSE